MPVIVVALKKALLRFPGGPVVKDPPCKAGDTGSILGAGRSHVCRGNHGLTP